MRDIKKCPRSEQRKLEAQKRNNSITEIMELSKTDDKKFYSLVNYQRQQNSLITSKLKYNDKVAECDEAIVETWAEYFEDLALMKSTKPRWKKTIKPYMYIITQIRSH